MLERYTVAVTFEVAAFATRTDEGHTLAETIDRAMERALEDMGIQQQFAYSAPEVSIQIIKVAE